VQPLHLDVALTAFPDPHQMIELGHPRRQRSLEAAQSVEEQPVHDDARRECGVESRRCHPRLEESIEKRARGLRENVGYPRENEGVQAEELRQHVVGL
jgi:hypothetical protein